VVPPAIEDAWRETIDLFRLDNCDTITNASLHKVKHPEKYDLIIVDEAHKFRNDTADAFDGLQRICKSPTRHFLPDGSRASKRVILVSATPLNNRPGDIRNLISLFQDLKESTLSVATLNEARVTAVGLCLYLAALSQSIPSRGANGTTYPRVLVLDDVLLSLEMAHRLPLLRVLRDHFKNWQVLLLTHDRSWYEIAKKQLEGWIHHELFCVRVGDHEQPVVREDQDHLYWALSFLDQGHVKAAAVHDRTKFELVLKWACHSFGLAVKYHPAAKKMPASDFWAALKSATIDIAPAPCFRTLPDGTRRWWQNKAMKERAVPLPLEKRIEHAVSWVLNPLSHSQTVDHYRPEIEDAIFAVDALETTVKQAIATQAVGPVALRQMLLALLAQRSVPPAAPPTVAPAPDPAIGSAAPADQRLQA
jgi:hypothetical protein